MASAAAIITAGMAGQAGAARERGGPLDEGRRQDPAAVARGSAIVASRSQGLCVLCHALPGQPPALQGTLGPSLAGVGGRLSPAQLRERLLAPERSHPDTVMPSYGRSDGFTRVAPAQRGQALLTPQQIDDVVAWLADQR